MVDILKECIRMLRRENKVLSWLLIVSLLVNVALATVIYIDNKASRIEKAAATYDITERAARRTECNPIITQQKSICRNYENQSLKHLSTNFYFQTPRKKFCTKYMWKSCLYGKSASVAAIPRAA